MARGWGRDEEDLDQQETVSVPRDTRGEDERRAEQARARRIQLLKQQRERILSEKTSNAQRRQALMAALEQVEAELAQLESNA